MELEAVTLPPSFHVQLARRLCTRSELDDPPPSLVSQLETLGDRHVSISVSLEPGRLCF